MVPEEKYLPSNFPYCDCTFLGEIKAALEECPGVYYISAAVDREGYSLSREYYVVEEGTSIISPEAKRYGKVIEHEPRFYIYDLDDPDSGHYIIEYEINRYRVKNKLPLDEGTSLLSIARYAMEYHPDYFGEIAPPMQSPWGQVTRYKIMMRGVFWIETEEARECLAVFRPIWESDFSEYTASLAVFTAGDIQNRDEKTIGFTFYSMENGCLPIFELWHDTEKIRDRVKYPQLMNAVWENHIEYALAWNAREQHGLHDISGMFLREMGIDVTLRHGGDDSIKLTKGAGTQYLIL